jgi:hypothetical protein
MPASGGSGTPVYIMIIYRKHINNPYDSSSVSQTKIVLKLKSVGFYTVNVVKA